MTVNDREINEPTVTRETDVIGLGGTRLSFRRFVRAEGERVDQLGQIEFQRTPYRPPVVSTVEAPELGPIPERGDQRRFQLLAVLAPLAAGLTLFAFSKQVQFLALTLMSPLVMVANSIEDKRSGRKRFRDQLADFRERLIAWRGELDALVEAERIERVRTAPDLAELARRAELRTVDLWARSRDSPDFLRFRAGLGSAPTTFEVELPRGGDDDLREEARQALRGVDQVHGVPITVDLADCGVVGLHGPDDVVNGVASSMVIQAACLHSPEDLTLVAAVGDRALGSWMKWLPHTRSVVSPLPGSHVATTSAEADTLLRRLLEVLDFRRAGSEREVAGRRWPWIVVVLDARLSPDPAGVARLLDECPDVGISVIWLADTAAEVPRQATQILVTRQAPGAALVGTLWSTDPEVPDREIDVEQLRSDVADRVARALAPIRDASTASLATSIPRTAPLLDVLGVGMPSPEWVTEQWLTARPYGLGFPVGMGVDGPLWLDLVEDGPHTLIGGTSGAGKSELLQSIVGVAGGASSADAAQLPVRRLQGRRQLDGVLRSAAHRRLRHQPRRRPVAAGAHVVARRAQPPHAGDGGPGQGPRRDARGRARRGPGVAGDRRRRVRHPGEGGPRVRGRRRRHRPARPQPRHPPHPGHAAAVGFGQREHPRQHEPAHLAAHARPSRVDRRDRQSRGRRHPGPAQGPRLRRDSVRAPSSPSRARSAARRSRPRSRSSPCSSPGSSTPTIHRRRRRRATPGRAPARRRPTSTPCSRPSTGRPDHSRCPQPIRPWRDVLPELVTIDDVLGDPRAEMAHRHPGRVIAVGMIDAPEQQDQYPALVDLEESGGWLVFGAGGAGKTTLLRTIAVSAAASGTADQVALLGLDFASRGLGAVNALAQVVDVATGDDLEAVTRHLAVLGDELVRRRRMLADANAEHLTAYNERHAPLARHPAARRRVRRVHVDVR